MHRSACFWSFTILFLSLFSLVNTAPVLTNAERLAKGLPLAKPKGWVARDINGVTRTVPNTGKVVARDGQPSGTPELCGVILVKEVNGNGTCWYVSKFTKHGLFKRTSDKAHALEVKLPSTTSLTGIKATNSAFIWLGFVLGTGAFNTGNLAAGSASYVALAGLDHETQPHAKPHKGAETDVWTLNTSTKELTPHWINAAGGAAKTDTLFFSESGDFFGIAGDLAAYNAKVPTSKAFEVTFTLVTI